MLKWIRKSYENALAIAIVELSKSWDYVQE